MINDAQYGDVAYHPEELAKYYSGEWTADELKKAHAKRVADDSIVKPQSEHPLPAPDLVVATATDRKAAEKAQAKAAKEGKQVSSPLVDILPKSPTLEQAQAIARVQAHLDHTDNVRNSQAQFSGQAPPTPSDEDFKTAKKFLPKLADPVSDPTVKRSTMDKKTEDSKAQAKADQMAKARAARANKPKSPAVKKSPKPAPVPKPVSPATPPGPSVADDIRNSQTREAPATKQE